MAAGCASAALLSALQRPVARRRLIALGGPAYGLQGQSRVGRLAVLGSAGALTLWLTAGTAATVAISAVVLVACVLSVRAAARRRERAAQVAVVEFCRAISAELRSGRIANTAFRAAADSAPDPLHTHLQSAIDVARGGDPHDLADAIAVAASAQVAMDGLHQLAACWRVVASSGAMLAPAIDRIADALQDQIELDRALGTALAAPRATVRLLAGLPIVGLLLGAAIGANPLAFLFGSPGGLVCTMVAAAFDSVGVLWARRISRRAAQIP